MKDNALTSILSHPDKDEVVAKLACDITPSDIHDWLKVKYKDQKALILSKKTLTTFFEEYFDAYKLLKEDAQKLSAHQLSPQEDLQLTLQGNQAYQDKLATYLNQELDIQTILRKMIARIELRLETHFELMADDERNIKPDRTVIEWMNLLLTTCEKYQPILQGTTETINIQNNYNIQIVDKKINAVYSAIREALAEIDYDSSLAFIANLNSKLAALEDSSDENPAIPVEHRLAAVEELSADLREKLQE